MILPVFDLKTVYIGSANLTGAGVGMKNAHKRNFEESILIDSENLVEAAINHFDEIWRGSACKKLPEKRIL